MDFLIKMLLSNFNIEGKTIRLFSFLLLVNRFFATPILYTDGHQSINVNVNEEVSPKKILKIHKDSILGNYMTIKKPYQGP